HLCNRSGRFVQLRLLSSHLASSEVLAEIGSCNTERTSERQFCEIVAIQAGDVLVVCAGQGLFGLHHLDAISDACGKALLGTGYVVVGQVHILMSDVNLLFGGTQIEKCSANVVINLPTDVFCFCLPLTQSRFRLGDVALDAAAGENWQVDSCLETENSVGLTER